MNNESLKYLKKQLTELGFSKRLFSVLPYYLEHAQENFQMLQRERSDGEKRMYLLRFAKQDEKTEEYKLIGYKATLRIAPQIPDVNINGINARKLDAEMKTIDWSIDHHSQFMIEGYGNTKRGLKFLEKLDSILKKVDKLYAFGKEGKDAAEKIMYKHWYGEPWQPNTLSLEHINKLQERTHSVDLKIHPEQTKFKTDEILKSASHEAVSLKQPPKEQINISQSKSMIMTEKELSMFENQLKHVGLKEAFTSDLINRMKSGEPEIKYPFTKMYDGDEAKATLHIKKSETTNLYFFNKFDLSVRKDGQTAEAKQTFFINDFRRRPQNGDENKYNTTFTFKEAFNYLSGRPVWKNFKNGNDAEFNAWTMPDFKNLLDNGSPKQKLYNQNYPFDLAKVMGNFSIWELTNNTYKERLIESLQRGNLQLVTFIGENKQKDKLYISPNIPFGTLKVYDQDKQPIPTQVLVEKGYIGKEFAEKLKERVEQFKQQNNQQQSQKSEQREKQTVSKSDSDGEKVGKEKRQRQYHKETHSQEKPKQRQRQKMH